SAGNQFSVEFAWISRGFESRLGANHDHHRNLWIVVPRGGIQRAAGVGSGVEESDAAPPPGNRGSGGRDFVDRDAGWAADRAAGEGATSCSCGAAQFSRSARVSLGLVRTERGATPGDRKIRPRAKCRKTGSAG